MIHRKWHEWLAKFESITTTSHGDGRICSETKHFQCFCGHQWSVETRYNRLGFKVIKTRWDYPHLGAGAEE